MSTMNIDKPYIAEVLSGLSDMQKNAVPESNEEQPDKLARAMDSVDLTELRGKLSESEKTAIAEEHQKFLEKLQGNIVEHPVVGAQYYSGNGMTRNQRRIAEKQMKRLMERGRPAIQNKPKIKKRKKR